MGKTYRRGDKVKKFDDARFDKGSNRDVNREREQDEVRREKANKKRFIEVEDD